MIKCIVLESPEERDRFAIGTVHEILHRTAPHFITDYFHCMELLTKNFQYDEKEANEILDKLNNYYKAVVNILLDIRRTKELDDDETVNELNRRIGESEFGELHDYLCSLDLDEEMICIK